MKYNDFLKTKKTKLKSCGFEVEEKSLNKNLFDFQKKVVQKALKKGRFAIFADTGMGKTIMQLEWANQVVLKTAKPVLILAPLAVSGQTIKEGFKFGIEVEKLKSEYDKPKIYISNYEQLKNIDVNLFSGIVLDESSILKNFTGKYKNLIIEEFKNTPYKLACTATPSPNDINEIGNHSEFLNILDATDMRAKWFVRDDGMNNYRLKGHSHNDFYGWVSSWCSMFSNPADIGFSETGKKYILPKLNYFERKIKTKKQDNGKLFNDFSVNATTFNRELKRSMNERLAEVVKIVNSRPDEYFIIWVNRNDEEQLLKKLLPTAVAVTGSEKPEIKERKLLDFADEKFKILITKKKIAQFGMNFQHCNNQIFAGLDFSFEGLYQAIRRSWRFGQKKDVNIFIVSTDTMENVVSIIHRKETQFLELQTQMKTAINKKYNLVMEYEKKIYTGKNYKIYQGDSVVEIDNIEDESLDFSIFSPPFSNLFTYSNNMRDMGNNDNDEEFFKQNQFLLDKLFKKMKPGRLVCVHSKDLAVYKGSSGYTGLKDFTGDYHRAMERAGFKYHSKVTIWTDPVLEMQRTKTQRLLYKQLRKDSTFTGVGLPEYLTIFKKWDGVVMPNPEPVNNKTFDNFPLDIWQEWASPIWQRKIKKAELVEMIETYYQLNGIELNEHTKELKPEWLTGSWFDIRRTDVLNGKEGTALGDEKHIAPLQLTVIRRALQMWSNPGDLVFTPFLGIGSEIYEALKLGRRGVGIELKPSYFETANKNLKRIELSQNQQTLF